MQRPPAVRHPLGPKQSLPQLTHLLIEQMGASPPHETPHFPQFFGSASTFVSQPLARFASQFPKPAPQQIPPEQLAFLQSASTLHAFPSSHFWQEPPQSTSVSVPFFALSMQLAAGPQIPPLHAPL